MENKELVKQLEGVGFKRYDHLLQLDQEDINNETITWFMNLSTDNFYCEYNIKDCDISAPTFPQIIAAIKEHTGVDLAKKTKREEIEELKKRVKVLDEKIEDSGAVFDAMLKGYFMSIVDTVQAQGAKIESLEDAIKSQNDVIEGLKLSNPLEVVKEITKVALHLKAMELSKKFENGGAIATARSGENVFSITPAPDMSDFKEMTDSMQAAFKESIKQEAEQQEKKAFEVGDRVVISEKAKGLYGFQIEAMHTQTPLTIRKVIDTQPKGYECEYLDNHVGTFPAKWLDEPAPAESPKEKALEFGDWAETLVGKVNIPKGSKVLITLHLDTDNDFYCSTGQSDSHFEYYKPEELKPL